jgi:ribosomal protein S27E
MAGPQKTDLLKDPKAGEKGATHFKHVDGDAPRKPADPIEHFRKHKCEKGHSDWDPAHVVYSADHRAWVLRCKPCGDDYIIPAGGYVAMGAPDGFIPDEQKS